MGSGGSSTHALIFQTALGSDKSKGSLRCWNLIFPFGLCLFCPGVFSVRFPAVLQGMLGKACLLLLCFSANAYFDAPPISLAEPWGLQYKCVFDVFVPHGRTSLGIRMSRKFVVQSFIRDIEGAAFGYAEATGYINVGDTLLAVNGWEVDDVVQRKQALKVLQAKHWSQPLVLRFKAKSCSALDNTPMDTAAQIVRTKRASGRLELMGIALNAFSKTVLDVSPTGAAADSLGQLVQSDDSVLALNGMSLMNLPAALYRRVLESPAEQRLLRRLSAGAHQQGAQSNGTGAHHMHASEHADGSLKDVWLLRSRSAFEPEAAVHLQGLQQEEQAGSKGTPVGKGAGTVVLPQGAFHVSDHGHNDSNAASEHARALGTVRCGGKGCSFAIPRGMIRTLTVENQTKQHESSTLANTADTSNGNDISSPPPRQGPSPAKAHETPETSAPPAADANSTSATPGNREASLPFVTALFGGDLPCYPVRLVVAQPLHACSPLANAEQARGAAVLVQRASCPFTQKAAHVQEAGAAAMVVFNVDGSPPVRMSGQGGSLLPGSSPTGDSQAQDPDSGTSSSASIHVPSVMVSRASALRLQESAAVSGHAMAARVPAVHFQSMLGRSPCDRKPGATTAMDSTLATAAAMDSSHNVLGATEFLRLLLSRPPAQQQAQECSGGPS